MAMIQTWWMRGWPVWTSARQFVYLKMKLRGRLGWDFCLHFLQSDENVNSGSCVMVKTARKNETAFCTYYNCELELIHLIRFLWLRLKTRMISLIVGFALFTIGFTVFFHDFQTTSVIINRKFIFLAKRIRIMRNSLSWINLQNLPLD